MYPTNEQPPAYPLTNASTPSPTSPSDVVQSIGTAAQQAAGQVQQQAGQVISQVQQQAGNVAQQVQGQARTQISTQKEQAATTLSGVAQAVQQIGNQMRQSGQAPLAQYADNAANQIQQTSSYLHDKTVEQLVGDVEGFARRQPALFVAGGLVLGILAARFIKSSSQHHA